MRFFHLLKPGTGNILHCFSVIIQSSIKREDGKVLVDGPEYISAGWVDRQGIDLFRSHKSPALGSSRRIPDGYGSVALSGFGRDQLPAVSSHRKKVYVLLMPCNFPDQTPLDRVPDNDLVVVSCGYQPFPAGTVNNRLHIVVMSLENTQLVAGGTVPDRYRIVIGTCCDLFSVRTSRNTENILVG